ncbi:MAG: hypothetical protein RL732_721 [Bacteroidota bacterium]
MEKLNVILTGATGMVGEGVLMECLDHPQVERVLVIGRRPSGIQHQKLRECVLQDFFDWSTVTKEISGYNACLFCLGTTSLGKKEEEYKKVTYDLTLQAAQSLVSQNPGMVFCYISGAGTDSSEQGRLMWARVKGKTENDLKKLPFRAVYNFRPGILIPTPGQKNILSFYHYLKGLFFIIRALAPGWVCSMKELGLAMINAAATGYVRDTIEIADIKALARDKK